MVETKPNSFSSALGCDNLVRDPVSGTAGRVSFGDVVEFGCLLGLDIFYLLLDSYNK